MTIAQYEQILAADVYWLTFKTAIPFWGTIAEIPSDALICDGNNGTPNLLAKFLEGVATAATNPGTTGGAVNKTTAGHTHSLVGTSGYNAPYQNNSEKTGGDTGSNTDTIADIRPPFYDVAFITKA
jgi:hypothetical protein